MRARSPKACSGAVSLYTNLSSISLGLVVRIKDLMEYKPQIEAPQLFEDFKQRPEIKGTD